MQQSAFLHVQVGRRGRCDAARGELSRMPHRLGCGARHPTEVGTLMASRGMASIRASSPFPPPSVLLPEDPFPFPLFAPPFPRDIGPLLAARWFLGICLD